MNAKTNHTVIVRHDNRFFSVNLEVEAQEKNIVAKVTKVEPMSGPFLRPNGPKLKPRV